MSRSLIKRDKNLLKLAQNIFGSDLVIDAFHCIDDYGDKNYIDKEINDVMITGQIKDDDKEISMESNDIRLVFCNGKIVHFSVSEWGDIQSPYNNEEYVEI